MSKLLGDFLQEQQEPFRRIKKKQLAVSPNCSTFLKAVFRLQFKRNALNSKAKQVNSTQNRFSSVSSATSLFNSSSDTETANARERDGKQLCPVSLPQDQTHCTSKFSLPQTNSTITHSLQFLDIFYYKCIIMLYYMY